MSRQPTISVVMAVHNSADYLRQALASIRWQTHDNWECICVDDGSTDATPAILADFATADERFRPLRQEKAGVVAALNLGDAAARAPVIARMDSDDVALPHRLALQLAFLQENPDCVAVGGDLMVTDPEGAPIGLARHATSHAEIERRLLSARAGTLSHPTMTMRRDAAIAAGGYRHEYEWAHDTDFITRLARVGELANLSQVLLLYRQHERSFCANRRRQIRDDQVRLLREAHASRGLQCPAGLGEWLASERPTSSMLGKWARRAARNGYFSTAAKLWRQQVSREPLSLLTARVTLEMALRGGAALARGKRGVEITVPEWRNWDCASQRAAA